MSIDVQNKYVKNWAKIIFPSFIAMTLGFVLNIPKTTETAAIILAIALSSFMLALMFLYQSLVSGVHAELPTNGSDNMELYYEIKIKKRRLTYLLFYLLPSFPIVYALAASGYLNPDQTIVSFRVCSMSTKVFYVIAMINAHTDVSHLLANADLNETRRAFLRYVMHEVRIPLNSVTAGIGVLRSYKLDEEGHDTLSMMDSATVYMAETLNNILSMQKIEEGKFELIMSPFLVQDSLNRVKRTLHGMLAEKKLKLDMRINSDIPPCLVGDCYRLEHALANLLSNAAKFSPIMGNISILVSLVGKVKNRSFNVKFSVTDEGPGMTDHQISQLFRPFAQLNAHELQRGGGSGVGLSICKKIIEQHGGTIEVDSVLGRGSTLSFIVPLAISLKLGPAANADDVVPIAQDPCHPKFTRDSVHEESYLSIDSSVHSYRCAPFPNLSMQTVQESDSMNTNKKTALVVDGGDMNQMISYMRHCVHKNLNNFTFNLLLCYICVSDVLSNRKLLCRLLHVNGYVTEQATDGEEALQKVASSPSSYDIIFMDNTMPKLVC